MPDFGASGRTGRRTRLVHVFQVAKDPEANSVEKSTCYECRLALHSKLEWQPCTHFTGNLVQPRYNSG
ncbi:high-potential iron-sulfur protein [Burkholderia vietnamiensis]|uniref:high-potential iron-sulfur protein n=1 Tax=Burkholderia vietnamiensis TaxID=60552 RepID=UPI003D15F538